MKTKKVRVLLGALAVMLIAWALNSCSKSDVVPTSFTTLTAEIAVAQNLIATTSEGTASGNYVRGSQATLLAAITAAQAVASNTATTQVQETAATAQLTAAVTAYQAAAVVPIDAADLVGQWTFDELTTAIAGTTVKDYSGNNFNGKITAGLPNLSTSAYFPWSGYATPATNIPTQTTDRYGNANKALHFQAGANVEVPYNAALNPPQMSISLWAKADSIPGDPGKYWANNYMLSMYSWHGWKFQIQDTPRAFFTAHVSGVNTPALGNSSDSSYYDRDMNVGKISPLVKWYHYVVTFGGGSESFYINGILVYTWTNVPGTIVNMAAHPVSLVIGQEFATSAYNTTSTSSNFYDWTPGNYFIGSLDEIRIYKSVLTASQVTSIYNLEKP